MHHYFAFGSNLDQDQMRARCPDARLLGVAELRGYQLAFTIYSPLRKCGCADILPVAGKSVFGLLYELTDDDLARMDEFEGHPFHYQRLTVDVMLDGKIVAAETYAVGEKKEGLRPSSEYLALIRNAAERFGFPEAYRDELANIVAE